jgi:serine/threonine protein phosphatase PrpC
MEDAAIHIINMTDGNSLFAVFDGHGGTTLNIQGIRSANMLLKFLLQNSRPSNLIKTKIMFKL